MGKQKYSKSFEIALSAISCAVAVLSLSMGVFAGGYFLGLWYLIAVLALMVPLAKQFYWGGFLAYLGTCILTVVLGAAARFWDLLPFIMFFGLHPLANALQIRFKINRWLAYAIKAVWFIGTLFAGYFMILYGFIGGGVTSSALYQNIKNYIYIIIPAAGAVAFLVYDYLIFKCQIMVNYLIYRIRK